jgi:hypothetical protein
MGQMYTNDVHFTKFYPMISRAEVPDTLIELIQDISIPSKLHLDNAKELTSGKMGDLLRKFLIQSTQSEPYSPWQVRAELCICGIKKSVGESLDRMGAPRCLWDYCARYHSVVRNLPAHPTYRLHGCTSHEIVTGRTPNILEYLDYAWYETVCYYDQEARFPEPRRNLAKWFGAAHRVGQTLCYQLLSASGRPIVGSTIQPLSRNEKKSEDIINRIKELDRMITDNISILPTQPTLEELRDIDVYAEDCQPYIPVEPNAVKPEVDDFTPEDYENLIAAEVLLPKGDILVLAMEAGRKHDENGNPVGISNTNPLLDTRVFNIQFHDGHTEEYAANSIIENIYSQLDPNGEC